jgi:hypothetical protein
LICAILIIECEGAFDRNESIFFKKNKGQLQWSNGALKIFMGSINELCIVKEERGIKIKSNVYAFYFLTAFYPSLSI